MGGRTGARWAAVALGVTGLLCAVLGAVMIALVPSLIKQQVHKVGDRVPEPPGARGVVAGLLCTFWPRLRPHTRGLHDRPHSSLSPSSFPHTPPRTGPVGGRVAAGSSPGHRACLVTSRVHLTVTCVPRRAHVPL
jgi:hypothetical protein